MHYPIDPTVDIVFKSLLGAEVRKPLLINFLNGVMRLCSNREIVDVELLNPYSEAQFVEDKINIVDIHARDQYGRKFQIEVQIKVMQSLPARIGYTWAKLHAGQLVRGEQYDDVEQSIAIWILANDLIPNERSSDFHHLFSFYDPVHELGLSDHCQIHTLELRKWQHNNNLVRDDVDRWLYFLLHGEMLNEDNLPDFLQTDIMRQAVATLNYFSEDEKARAIYETRLASIRKEKSEQRDMEALRREHGSMVKERDEMLKERDAVVQERDAVVQERDAVVQERNAAVEAQEALLQKLKSAGIDPERLL